MESVCLREALTVQRSGEAERTHLKEDNQKPRTLKAFYH